MPVAHLFKNDLLMFKAHGQVTVDDFYRAWDRIKSDLGFHLPLDLLIDLREAHVDVPGHVIEGIVYTLKRNQFFNKMVFVAERGSFTYAMGRMFCINAECAGCHSEIFLRMADALAWLEGESIQTALPTCTPPARDPN